MTDEADARQTEAAVKLLPTFEHFFAIENVLEDFRADLHLRELHEELGVAPDAVELVHARCDGNPLFAQEILAAWEAAGLTVTDADVLTTSADAETLVRRLTYDLTGLPPAATAKKKWSAPGRTSLSRSMPAARSSSGSRCSPHPTMDAPAPNRTRRQGLRNRQ